MTLLRWKEVGGNPGVEGERRRSFDEALQWNCFVGLDSLLFRRLHAIPSPSSVEGDVLKMRVRDVVLLV